MPASIVRLYPDSVLRKKCETVRNFDSQLHQIIAQMTKVMKKQVSGIGIAAPQVGISLKIALVDVSARIPGRSLLVLINPEVLCGEGESLKREGCMSLPEYTAFVKRYDRVLVRRFDEQGQLFEEWFEGIEARCIQHEIDHLNGYLFFDRVTSLRTDMRPRKP